MTRKEERTQSFVWCVSDYLSALQNKVNYGQINANKIATALKMIIQLNELANSFIVDYLDEKQTEDLFIEIELKLNKLIKS